MIEKRFDIPFVADLASREKQIQQSYRPVISVHKWFARRPGTLFRSLLLAEFGDGSLREKYFRSNNLGGILVADPFMGGGTPVLEANRLGCSVIGYDINPMAYWIVREEVERIDLAEYHRVAACLLEQLKGMIGGLYETSCLNCGRSASVKYFLWVKTQKCKKCDSVVDLFPGYLIAEDARHPKNVYVCAHCGELSETDNVKSPGPCNSCGKDLLLRGVTGRNRFKCPCCRNVNVYPDTANGHPTHRMFAIEYHCRQCNASHKGRFFKKAGAEDERKYSEAVSMWKGLTPNFVPDDEIPAGDETDRLHRWGYRKYSEMFNERQLLGLELSCQIISRTEDKRIRYALSTNLSDLLRYQNMLCRYDKMALKSLDIFSVHGFPVGLIQCESNLLGLSSLNAPGNIGSGGWSNIIAKYSRAKAYCEKPFEIMRAGPRRTVVDINGEWIGEHREGVAGQDRVVNLHCRTATLADLAPGSLDAVMTDPPYLGNVQYAELMDFCYVWLRCLVGAEIGAFSGRSTRNCGELTANVTMERGLSHFTEGMAKIFSLMARSLKPGAPLVFTYHHNTQDAYYPIVVAVLDARLTCSASLPCPGEMAGSIHINHTSSSKVDTVFVCRSTGKVPRRWIVETPNEIAALVRDDIVRLRAGGVSVTRGDIRCLIFGHLSRMAIWALRANWDPSCAMERKLSKVRCQIGSNGGLAAIETHLGTDWSEAPKVQEWKIREITHAYEVEEDNEVSF